MALPIVFRRVAKLEMDESISWYEAQRVGLGLKFAAEIDVFLPELPRCRNNFRKFVEK